MNEVAAATSPRCRRCAGTSRRTPTTWSSSAAVVTGSRPRTTSRPATASPTSRWSRRTTSGRATPVATRRSSAPTTASPRRSASTSTASSCTRRSRTRPALRSCTSTKGIFWLAHTEMAMRTERARALMNTACGAKTVMVTPDEIKELVPADRPVRRRRYPVLGASHHLEAATARHDRVVWAYAPVRRSAACTSSSTRRSPACVRDGDRVVGVETARRPDRGGHRRVGGRRAASPRSPRRPASGCRSAPIRSTRS